jgi:hypothetical protein
MTELSGEFEKYKSDGDVELPIDITLDESLIPVVDSFHFDVSQFNSWITRRLGPASTADLGSLAIHFSGTRHPLDSDPPTTDGTFNPKCEPPLITVYIPKFLNVFYDQEGESGPELRTWDFNKSINGTLAHETEHWVDSIKFGSEIFYSDRRKKLDEGLIVLQESLPTSPTYADYNLLMEQCGDLVATLKDSHNREEYLARPHEIRAREAADSFKANEPLIATFSLASANQLQ